MNEYTLYLDESSTHVKGNNKTFAIGGIIVANRDLQTIEKSINDIKKNDME